LLSFRRQHRKNELHLLINNNASSPTDVGCRRTAAGTISSTQAWQSEASPHYLDQGLPNRRTLLQAPRAGVSRRSATDFLSPTLLMVQNSIRQQQQQQRQQQLSVAGLGSR